MQKGKFNVVTDGMWGSCGKGAIATFLAWHYQVDAISTTNLPNAGHTSVNGVGEKFIAKALPSGTALWKWMGNGPDIYVGATAGFFLDQLLKEIAECRLPASALHIHPRAGVLLQRHKEAESQDEGDHSTKHIASTMQGCGAFAAEKLLRKKDVSLAQNYRELERFVRRDGAGDYRYQPSDLKFLLDKGKTVLHEGSQGFSLCINHGSHYPQCTSRGTTAVNNLADMGLPTAAMGDVYVVIRPYPIRVGNVVEDGVLKGESGGCYDDQHEMTWEEVAAEAGAPPEIAKGELTTVTGRLRRVFSFSQRQVQQAIDVNGATKIALNFANYVDYGCFGMNKWESLPRKVRSFIDMLEETYQIPVALAGTGPQINHVALNPNE